MAQIKLYTLGQIKEWANWKTPPNISIIKKEKIFSLPNVLLLENEVQGPF